MDFLSVLTNFATDLKEVFGDESEDICKYHELVMMIDRGHMMMIKKHKRVMRNFLEVNKNNILNRDPKLKEKTIKYSSGVSVNIAQLFSDDDPETNDAIWKHLAVIASSLDIISSDVLKQLHTDAPNTPNVPDITNMMSMMSGLGGMMGGGGAGMNDQAKLMSTMAPMLTNMMSDMKGSGGGKPDVKKILKSSMQAMGNDDVNPDDLLKNIDTIMNGLKHQIKNDSSTKNAVKSIMRNFQKDFNDDDLDNIINSAPRIIEETLGDNGGSSENAENLETIKEDLDETPEVASNEID